MELTKSEKRIALVEAFLQATKGDKGAARGAIFIRQHIIQEDAFAKNHGIKDGETVQQAINRKDEAIKDFAVAVLNSLKNSPTQYQGALPEIETSATEIKKEMNNNEGSKIYMAMKLAAHHYVRSMAAHPHFQGKRELFLKVA